MNKLHIAILLALSGITLLAEDTNTSARIVPPPVTSQPIPAPQSTKAPAIEAWTEDSGLLGPITEAPPPLRRSAGQFAPADLERLEILRSITREVRGTNDVLVHHAQYLQDMSKQLTEIQRFLDGTEKLTVPPKSKAQVELEEIEQELSRLRLRTQGVRETLNPPTP
jgi:hypothetical protein